MNIEILDIRKNKYHNFLQYLNSFRKQKHFTLIQINTLYGQKNIWSFYD